MARAPFGGAGQPAHADHPHPVHRHAARSDADDDAGTPVAGTAYLLIQCLTALPESDTNSSDHTGRWLVAITHRLNCSVPVKRWCPGVAGKYFADSRGSIFNRNCWKTAEERHCDHGSDDSGGAQSGDLVPTHSVPRRSGAAAPSRAISAPLRRYMAPAVVAVSGGGSAGFPIIINDRQSAAVRSHLHHHRSHQPEFEVDVEAVFGLAW